jgi:protein-L-isoaspartate(D-aspartate) O-methyltransferase
MTKTRLLLSFASLLLSVFLALQPMAAAPVVAPQDQARLERLLSEVERMVTDTRHMTGLSRLDARVRQALLQVPRHQFVPSGQRRSAYDNRPLSIGYGQTISQPYIVALMTALLELEPQHRVLEVGTGSGYQAAVLSPLVERVFSIEVIAPLAEQASERLRRLGFVNVITRQGDGYFGWPEEAPFDAIIVTAAAGHVPPPLIEQLRPGGRMVIPVGGRFMTQQLLLIEKNTTGQVQVRQLLPVAFVPLTGDH